ncbi:MAG: ribosomal protein S18-alanine N-acetyltransferase [Tissierellia bacterium]|nr:ribosomal protein S18-alanine N-acetyltransferase [Tissierellia bacterium]
MIREMNVCDVDRVYEIENDSFFNSWSRKTLLNELLNNKLTKHFVYEEDGEIKAFYEAGFIIDESELKTIAVDKRYQNKKIGTKLIEHYIHLCSNNKIKKIYLEVRVKNTFAIKLYEKFGFKIVALRKNYYKKTNEDAYLMLREEK